MSNSIAIPSPRYGASARLAVASTSSESLHSDRSATSSPSSSWAPSGVYVPVHKRQAANSSVSSLPGIGSPSNPVPRIYSRAALLSLARSPLSSHPEPSLTTDLRSACPEIVDEHASGIARALAMGKSPVWHGNSGKSRGRRPRGAKRGSGNGGRGGQRDESLSSVGSERSRGSWRSN